MTSESCYVGFNVYGPKGNVVLSRCTVNAYNHIGFKVIEQGQPVSMTYCHVGEGTKTEIMGIGVIEKGKLVVSDCRLQCCQIGAVVSHSGGLLRMI